MALLQTASQDDAPVIEDHDFDAIEAAVLETARGRWFLREFGRRLKAVENERVLEALVRIERLLAESRSAMVKPVAAMEPLPKTLVPKTLGAPAPEASGQVTDLRFAVRLVQLRLIDLAGNMRASGVDAHFCDQIEQQARAFVEIASGRSPAEPVHIQELSLTEELAPVKEHAPVEALHTNSISAPVAMLPELRAVSTPASLQQPLEMEASAQLPPVVERRDFATAFPELSETQAHPKPPLEPLIRRLPPTSVRFTRDAAPPREPASILVAPLEPDAGPPESDPPAPLVLDQPVTVEPAMEAPAMEAPAIALPVVAPRPSLRPPVNPAAFMAIDALSQREKSALFA